MHCVSNSVMPKGVEHRTSVAEYASVSIVSNSVMPKGVEHTALARRPSARLTCAEFSDAERR